MHQMYRKYVPNIMDDSLSLYEQMIAVIEHINNVVKTSDKLSDEVSADMNELITEVFKSKAILVGSPTVNNGPLHSITGILGMIKGMKFKKKKAGAFGSYGWSGEVVKQLNDSLEGAGFSLVDDGVRSLWVPDEEEREKLVKYGEEFVEKL